eukprot:s664_g7.t1
MLRHRTIEGVATFGRVCAVLVFVDLAYDECLFTLLAATVNFDDAIPTCEGLAADFRDLRCPTALIDDKVCQLTDSCQAVAVCEPSDGECYYTSRPDFTPCDDGLHYTHTDICVGAVCRGIEDKCIRFNVTCQTLNNCLVPTDKVRNSCDPSTGSCVFEARPDGTACSSQPGGLIDGTCDAGLSVDALADHPSAVPSDDLEQVKLHKAAAAESPRSPNDPRGQVQQDLANQGSAEELSTEASKNSKDG